MDNLGPILESLVREARREGIDGYVVGAVIRRNRSVLILRRKSDDFLGGFWELPGGNIEPAESLVEGLCREVEEETGLTVRSVLRFLSFFDYSSSDGSTKRQFNFEVSVDPEETLRLEEHDAASWVSVADIKAFAMSSEMCDVIEKALRS